MSAGLPILSDRGLSPSFPTSRIVPGTALLLGILGAGLAVAGAKLPAAACLGSAAGLMLLARPEWATLAAAMLLYSNAAAVATKFHGIPRMAVAAGFFGLLAVPLYYHLVVRRRPMLLAPAVPLIFCFVGVQSVSMLFARRSDVALESLLGTLGEGLLLFLLITNIIRDTATLRRVVWVLVATGGVLAAMSVYQQATGNFGNTFGGFAQVPIDPENPRIVPESARTAGPIGEKNYYAQFLLLLLPLALTFSLVRQARMLRWAAAVAAALIALAIAFTASRGAVVGGLAMVASMVAMRQLKARHVAVLAAAAVLISLASPQLRTRALTMIDVARYARGQADLREVDTSTRGRFSEMYAAALIFTDHPILGVGPGNFPAAFLDKADALGVQVHAVERLAHCAVLEIAAENGILGLLCIAAVLAVGFRELRFARRSARDPEARALATAFLAVLIVLVASSFFLSFAYVRYYWFMLALAAVAARLAAATAGGSPSPIPRG